MSSDRMFRPNEEQLELLKRWYAPDVSKPVNKKATNAFGMTAEDIANPKTQSAVTEPVEQQPAQVTVEELEEIRQSAQQEGFEQGYSKGHDSGLLKGHDEGYQQGLEQGKTDGHQQGYAEGKSQVESQIALLNQLVAQLHNPLDHQEQQIEQALLSLALDVAKKIVHTEVQQNHQPIIQAISEGVKLLAGNEPIIIRLNPHDIENVREVWGDEQLTQQSVVMEADHTLSLGSCNIESKMSTVTFDLSSRITQVFEDFYSQPKPPTETELQGFGEQAEITDITFSDESVSIDDAGQNPATVSEQVTQ